MIIYIKIYHFIHIFYNRYWEFGFHQNFEFLSSILSRFVNVSFELR